MGKHSEGPWEFEQNMRPDGVPIEGHEILAGDDRDLIAEVWGGEDVARLIAAAPELLEALQAIARQACVQPDRDHMQAYSDIELIRELAESAIAQATTNKAEGG